MQIKLQITSCVPPPFIWHRSQIIVNILLPIVTICILNQSRGHWLLSDALQTTISMSLKLKEEMNNFLVLDLLVKSNDFSLDIELGVFAKKHEQGSYWGH
jgi:hypothetical protein